MSLGRQIRAARGLLRWSSSTLAAKAGLTRETINKIEDDAVQPREGTLQDIKRVFDENGVEFLDNTGVRLKPQGIEVLTGPQGFYRFYEILYADMMSNGGWIGACGVDESLFVHYLGEHVEPHIARMNDMCRSRHLDHCIKILIREGDNNFVADGYSEYRWLSPENYSPTCFYVFNNYLALINFTAEPAPHVILISSAAYADAYRQQFNKLWDTAKIPPEKK
jgi:DNA-binding XRE family transcriptional regulator